MKLLRLFIRESLRRLYERKVLSEPDVKNGKEQEEAITLAANGIRGLTAPLGDDAEEDIERSDVAARAFGGGKYED